MKHKVGELEGMLLDAAVEKAEGVVPPGAGAHEFSKNWRHAGRIIERERLLVGWNGDDSGWVAAADGQISDSESDKLVGGRTWQSGPTAIVAAMRAYVASKYGEEIELP